MLLDITSFLGRFHPLFVHLPIGFIIIAVVLEWRANNDQYQKPISYIWLLSAFTAGISSLFGWFLANDGSYANWPLFFHRWLGIIISAVCLFAWYVRRGESPNRIYKKTTNISAMIMLAITGHLGGNMTHGSDYLLEYAPKPIRSIFGYNTAKNVLPQFSNPDSVFVFKDIIYPTIEKKCIGCHSDKVQNGGLNISNIESLSKGGDSGPVIEAGKIESEFLRRVTLPVSSSKFMPSSGTPLTYHEIKLLEWWISEGADYTAPISQLNSNSSIQTTLLSLYGLDLTPRPWIEKKKVPFLDSSIFEVIRSSGLRANQLSRDNGWIEVSVPIGGSITSEQLSTLKRASQQITWINLANSGLQDEQISFLSELPHLTRIRIQDNEISTEGVKVLTKLKYLESLNLTNTKVDDQIFDHLSEMTSLKNIYLWKSGVTKEKFLAAQKEYPDLNIVLGITI